jgi:aspartate kinase
MLSPNRFCRTFLEQNNRVALVCSAMSGNTKLTGTTNLLLRAALEVLQPFPPPADSTIPTPPRTPQSVPSFSSLSLSQILTPRCQGGSPVIDSRASSPARVSPGRNSISSLRNFEDSPPLFSATVDLIRDNHLKAARASIKDERILKPLEDDLIYDCERLRSFLLAAQVTRSISFFLFEYPLTRGCGRFLTRFLHGPKISLSVSVKGYRAVSSLRCYMIGYVSFLFGVRLCTYFL